jgi:hypothetical protein
MQQTGLARAATTLEFLLLFAALAHLFQLPAMLLAARRRQWDAEGETPELAERVHRVLGLTLPLCSSALGALLLVNHTSLLSSGLGLGLSCVTAGQLALAIRRRLGDSRLHFARQRQEIVHLLLALGLVVAVNRQAVLTTALGAQLCIVLSSIYSARAWLQLVYYRRAWPKGAPMRVAHWALTLLFTSQAGIYASAALGAIWVVS